MRDKDSCDAMKWMFVLLRLCYQKSRLFRLNCMRPSNLLI